MRGGEFAGGDREICRHGERRVIVQTRAGQRRRVGSAMTGFGGPALGPSLLRFIVADESDFRGIAACDPTIQHANKRGRGQCVAGLAEARPAAQTASGWTAASRGRRRDTEIPPSTTPGRRCLEPLFDPGGDPPRGRKLGMDGNHLRLYVRARPCRAPCDLQDRRSPRRRPVIPPRHVDPSRQLERL